MSPELGCQPCPVATLVRRQEDFVAGASASKVCAANGDLHLSSALLSSVSSDRALWSTAGAFELCVFPELSSLRPATVRLPASGLRGAHSRRSSEIARSRSCSCSRCSWPLFGFVPRGQRAPLDSDMHRWSLSLWSFSAPLRACCTSSAASGRCYAPLSCSLRAAPNALVAKSRFLVLSHSPVHLVSLMHWFA